MSRLKSIINGSTEVLKETGSLAYLVGKTWVRTWKGIFDLTVKVYSASESITESRKEPNLSDLEDSFYKQGRKEAPEIYGQVEKLKKSREQKEAFNDFFRGYYKR